MWQSAEPRIRALLAVENIDHTRTKAKSPQTNSICKRFNKTILGEFYQVALRKKLYRSIAELQPDLDVWMRDYNTVRTHQGRWCFGKTPMQTFIDTLHVAKETLLQVCLQQSWQGVAILNVSRGHLAFDRQAQRVDSDVSLAAFHLFSSGKSFGR